MFGANGAGKTTTINIFLNFIPPTEGQALIEGIDVTKEPLRSKEFVLLRLGKRHALRCNFHGLPKPRLLHQAVRKPRPDQGPISPSLTSVGLQKDASTRGRRTISKGMRQKLGLAIASSKDTPTSFSTSRPRDWTPNRGGISSICWSRCATRASRCFMSNPRHLPGKADRRSGRGS